jgi:membrane-bound lytic murein transglycosylase D
MLTSIGGEIERRQKLKNFRNRAYFSCGASAVAIFCLFSFSEVKAADLREVIARRVAETCDLEIDVNEHVLQKIDFWLSTAGRKQWLAAALKRKNELDETLTPFIEKYNLPTELLYLPVIESGYRNKDWGDRLGGGIWALMPKTAQIYGLVVTEVQDDRLDIEKATSAALRYLRYQNKKFKDWRLAIRAYNEGPGKVAKRIKEHGTRDAWAIETAAPSKAEYLQNFFAVTIIGEAPELFTTQK